MAIKVWSDFYMDTLHSLPECPIPILERALRNATINLCSQSQRLKYEMPAFLTVSGTNEYPLSPGIGYETITILDGSINGFPIDPFRRDELVRIINWQSEQGRPSRYLMNEDTETVRLWKIPDAAYTVLLTLAIKPNNDATGIEEWFGERFKDGIISGALSMLMAIPNKPWTNAQLAIFHDGKFKSEVIRASAEAERDATRAPLRTTKYGKA
jgi:hypothetical protein